MAFITASVTGTRDAITAGEGVAAEIVSDAMRGATDTLKQVLRRQVTDAGLGARLANTWRATTYPETGAALTPAGYAWSNAPAIIDAFARGATIRPLGGKNYLWVPTKSVPRARGTGRGTSTKTMTPDQVLDDFKVTEFVIKKGRRGNLLAFIVEGRGQTARGAMRKVRRGRLAHGTSGELVLMFTLTTSVRLPKAFDLQDAADAGAASFVDRVEQGTAL